MVEKIIHFLLQPAARTDEWLSLLRGTGAIGIAFGVLLFIFKDVIALNLYPRFTRDQSLRLFKTIIWSSTGLVALTLVLPYFGRPFSFTVHLREKNQPPDSALSRAVLVLIDLDGNPRSTPINNGDATFSGLPSSSRDQEVTVELQSDDLELAEASHKIRLTGGSADLAVRVKAGHISGYVKDEDGNPLEGVSISVAGESTTTNKAGYFEIVVPGEKVASDLMLEAAAHGYFTELHKAVLNSNEMQITLRRKR